MASKKKTAMTSETPVAETQVSEKPASETIGEKSLKLSQKKHDPVRVVDEAAEALKDYASDIKTCINRYNSLWICDFYVVVILKKEPLLQNVMVDKFFGRMSCPTPDYDQTVYFYDKMKEKLTFLWQIPSKPACLYMIQHKALIPPKEYALLKDVIDFAEGNLYRLAKRLNNEKIEFSDPYIGLY